MKNITLALLVCLIAVVPSHANADKFLRRRSAVNSVYGVRQQFNRYFYNWKSDTTLKRATFSNPNIYGVQRRQDILKFQGQRQGYRNFFGNLKFR